MENEGERDVLRSLLCDVGGWVGVLVVVLLRLQVPLDVEATPDTITKSLLVHVPKEKQVQRTSLKQH